MKSEPIPRYNVAMGDKQPEYETLWVRGTINPEYSCAEYTAMFVPSAEELELLNKGHPLLLSQLGGWRPVTLLVSETPDGS